jgi:ATP-dependent protease ClpP protease subunit
MATSEGSNGTPAGGSAATVDIFDVIDSWGGWFGISAGEVDAALAQAGDVDTLYVRINSPGGEALEGVAIGNLLRAHKATVHVTVYGLAASAASAVAMAGDTIAAGPGSMMMIHDASNIAWGDAAELRAEAAILDTLSDGYAALYAAKAGGTAAEWRARMQATTWYTAEQAVTAGLADRVGLDPAPAVTAPETDLDEELAELVEAVTAQDNARAARAVARAVRRFDLAMLPNAPAALLATETPAAEPVAPSTNPEEADPMSDTLLDGLRKQLGLPDDADEATVLAANAEALAERADPPAEPAAEPVIPAGMQLVSDTLLNELKAGAQAGIAARQKQQAEERDAAIAKAFSDGKISADSRADWAKAWDLRPEQTAKELDSLGVRFPVAKVPAGYAGSEDDAGEVMSEAEAKAIAARSGMDYRELMAP